MSSRQATKTILSLAAKIIGIVLIIFLMEIAKTVDPIWMNKLALTQMENSYAFYISATAIANIRTVLKTAGSITFGMLMWFCFNDVRCLIAYFTDNKKEN